MKLISLLLCLMLQALALSEAPPKVVQPAFTFELGTPLPTAVPDESPKLVNPSMSFELGASSVAPFKRYDNLRYHYGFSLPADLWLDQEGNDLKAENKVYDNREWVSPDGSLRFFFQLKEPTYRDLQEEIDQLPDTLEIMRGVIGEMGGRNLRYATDEAIVHSLPAGMMLENATLYEMYGTEHVQIYLDYYDGYNEYIFGLTTIDLGYEQSQALLLRIGRTITAAPIRVE